MRVLRKMHDLATTPWDMAVTHLLIGAIFFAMWSCEYLRTTTRDGTKRTKIMRLGGIVFKKDGRILNQNSPDLHEADIVRLTFEYQKNDRRDVSIHMFSTEDDILDPVAAWATTVRRVRLKPDADDNSEVCLFCDAAGSITRISADHVRSRLRAIVHLLGENELGFKQDDIGLHSIRSGGAMAMFLSGTAVIIIMRIGRWSSEAFLEYIREQVESFTVGVSQRMLQYESFFNLSVPDTTPTEIDAVEEIPTPFTENGSDSVPFHVRFNRLALGGRRL